MSSTLRWFRRDAKIDGRKKTSATQWDSGRAMVFDIGRHDEKDSCTWTLAEAAFLRKLAILLASRLRICPKICTWPACEGQLSLLTRTGYRCRPSVSVTCPQPDQDAPSRAHSHAPLRLPSQAHAPAFLRPYRLMLSLGPLAATQPSVHARHHKVPPLGGLAVA